MSRPTVFGPPEADYVATVEHILERADAEGRSMLFEHEVYAVLSALSIPAPVHVLVRDQRDISSQILSLFPSDRIVLKAVSKRIVHKQSMGGVRVVLKDIGFVRYTYDQMVEAFAQKGIYLEGILFVEHVAYERDLGNETLIGLRESRAFGPVLSLSKGGSDAEHFAENYSPPNIILAPVDREWATALLSSTRVQSKYRSEGKNDHIAKIIEAIVKVSDLSIHFSRFFENRTRFVLSELEVNPFVFDPDGAFIPLDGFARFERKDDRVFRSIPVDRQSLVPFFVPQGVAVIGVSADDNSKAANIIVRNLAELGRTDVVCVNPKGGTAQVAGRSFSLLRSVREIERRIDLAIVCVPARAAAAVVEDCAEIGARAVLVVSGGFSETTGDASVEDHIRTLGAEAGMRIMGPNCLGVVYTGDGSSPGMNTFFLSEDKFQIPKRDVENVAIVSQSGAVGIVEVYNLRNAVSPAAIVSYGNQVDVDPCDLAAFFADDPDVDVIGFYIEGFKEGAGRRFFDICATIRKPIVVYKAGRTQAGMMATASHTASISGEYAVAKAAMKQAGCIVADTMLDHVGYMKTFALLRDSVVNGRRVAVVTNAGYEKTNAADHIGELELASLCNETQEVLQKLLPGFVSVSPLLDLTPMVSDEQFGGSIEALLSCDRVDAVCVSVVPQAELLHTTDEEIEGYRDNVAARIVESTRRHRKPVVVAVTAESGSNTNYNRFSSVLESGGVPTFLGAERAMMFLNAFVRYHLGHRRRNFADMLR